MLLLVYKEGASIVKPQHFCNRILQLFITLKKKQKKQNKTKQSHGISIIMMLKLSSTNEGWQLFSSFTYFIIF
jgi:hypothetical protein